MIRIIFPLLVGIATLLAGNAAAAGGATLRSDAPDSHVVVKGDTLWGISGRFLNEPCAGRSPHEPTRSATRT